MSVCLLRPRTAHLSAGRARQGTGATIHGRAIRVPGRRSGRAAWYRGRPPPTLPATAARPCSRRARGLSPRRDRPRWPRRARRLEPAPVKQIRACMIRRTCVVATAGQKCQPPRRLLVCRPPVHSLCLFRYSERKDLYHGHSLGMKKFIQLCPPPSY